MQLKDLGTYKIPAYYITYLEYGDTEGLTLNEIENCDAFCAELGDSLVFEPYFSRNNDITGLGGDVIDCFILRHI